MKMKINTITRTKVMTNRERLSSLCFRQHKNRLDRVRSEDGCSLSLEAVEDAINRDRDSGLLWPEQYRALMDVLDEIKNR